MNIVLRRSEKLRLRTNQFVMLLSFGSSVEENIISAKHIGLHLYYTHDKLKTN